MTGTDPDREPSAKPRWRLATRLRGWWRRYVLATTPRCIREGEHDWKHECEECQSWW